MARFIVGIIVGYGGGYIHMTGNMAGYNVSNNRRNNSRGNKCQFNVIRLDFILRWLTSLRCNVTVVDELAREGGQGLKGKGR